jgi:hypothetical protein
MNEEQSVQVTRLRIPFSDLVWLLVNLAFAVPLAMILVWLILLSIIIAVPTGVLGLLAMPPALIQLAGEWKLAHPDAAARLPWLLLAFFGLWAAVSLIMQMRKPSPMVLGTRGQRPEVRSQR